MDHQPVHQHPMTERLLKYNYTNDILALKRKINELSMHQASLDFLTTIAKSSLVPLNAFWLQGAPLQAINIAAMLSFCQSRSGNNLL